MTRMERVKNEKVGRRVRMREKMSDRVDRSFVKRLRHVDLISMGRLAAKVCELTVAGINAMDMSCTR